MRAAHGCARAAQEALLRCLYSIADNNSYLLFNRDPVDRMVAHLHAFFRAECAEPGASLAIHGGMQGARLTHSHERQYHYVLQSLTLWREISHEARRPHAGHPSASWNAGKQQRCCRGGVAMRCWLGVPTSGLPSRHPGGTSSCASC